MEIEDNLTRLNLKDNCLNDSDIKLFTLPLRVMKFAGFGEENQITTDGWAASVIANWTTTIKTVKKEPSTTNTKVQSFYAMKTKAKTLQGTNSNNCKFKEMEQVPVIILHNALSLAKRSQGTAMVEISQENERKNGKGQDSETKHASYIKHKRKKQSSGDDKKPLMDLDEDMMQSYLSSSGIVTYSDNKKRKLTLANL
ncbi:hypothetical protein QZH41_010615 [Actinostola sp. cb2023]|nr:hypothetical protein QZH41_010615 [Actinostola sp. cb2023]